MIRTHFNRMHIALGIVTVTAALSTGCASTSPEQAKVKQLATSVEDISRQWKQGNDLVVSGEKVKGKGSELVAEGQKQIAEGENLISRGKTLMAESENAFRDTSKKAGGPVSLAK
jgi:outer membrane murein-binding lipoprotein Lpp